MRTAEPLAAGFDAVLLDLDGVVYIGPDAVPHAAQSIATVRAMGLRCCFVTNNANRSAEVVAVHLTGIGVAAEPTDVVTSPQAAVTLLAERVPAGSAVLVVGGPGIDDALRERGYVPVRDHGPDVAAVMQGFSPELRWRDLAVACFAVEAGLLWIATNMDRTIPTPDGIAPGNGAFVDLVAGISGRRPDAVAGKPEPALLREAVARTAAQAPLMVGDRLDTDIAAGVRSVMPTLLVLTGVTDPIDLFRAEPHERPDFVGADLRVLLAPYIRPTPAGDGGVRCGDVRARVADGRLAIEGNGPVGEVLHAAAAACWAVVDTGGSVDWDAAAATARQVVTTGTVGGT